MRPIEYIAEECVNCGICVKECAFLQEYGSPQKLASQWLTTAGNPSLMDSYPFHCSLCGLCHGVCPKELDPSAMFLAMRRELVDRGKGRLKQHRTIRAYEKRGSSSLFSWYCFPPGCHTVFFPGCALPGSRPQTFTRLLQVLQQENPAIGFVLDCCTKPSHDLGDTAHFSVMFQGLCDILRAHSVEEILVACPNCYRIFSEYGESFKVKMVYEELAKREWGDANTRFQKEVTVHDPCGVRFAKDVQGSIRKLVQQLGLSVREMKHNCNRSFCCGEGGSAGFVRSDLAEKWTEKRVQEAEGTPIVSYCAGCTHFLGRSAEIYHLLDLLLTPDVTFQDDIPVSKAPITYWNRYRLKKKLQKQFPDGVSGNRKKLILPSSRRSD